MSAHAGTPAAGRKGPITRAMEGIGDFGLFSVRAVGALAGVWHYTSEILRQTGILIVGSTLAALSLPFIIGGECSLYGDYFLRSAGAQDYLGLVTSYCAGRGVVPLFFGYIFAAKVGCGLVAEIGSMRISEELDAFESVGVDPMRFVVATRIAGVALFVVAIFPLASLATSIGAELTALHQLQTVSKGGFLAAHWNLQGVGDLAFTFTTLGMIALSNTLVACYYGYRVRGGPVEVGTATSRSMVVNLVLIHVIYATMIAIWYGINPYLPIGG
jgi:phospholipid/cholesterol/gamma-HCH transport system permease protein